MPKLLSLVLIPRLVAIPTVGTETGYLGTVSEINRSSPVGVPVLYLRASGLHPRLDLSLPDCDPGLVLNFRWYPVWIWIVFPGSLIKDEFVLLKC